MSAEAIIIDCDPGQDDAVALLMALARPDALDVLAVTAVGGNVPLKLTEANARRIVALAGRGDVPVFAGCDRPLLLPLETAEYVHGETGLNGADLPEAAGSVEPMHAVDVIVDLLAHKPAKSVTLVPTGPLTNIAMAFIKAPEIMRRAKRIVLMGGAIEFGNVTPAAEFNIYVDPHAAKLVFESGVPVVMFGLDVTHKVLVRQAHLEAIKAIGNRASVAVHGMLDFYTRFDRERYGIDGGPLHDPCTVAWLLKPALFAGRHCHVEVEAASPLTRGMTVVDWLGRSKEAKNALVMREADATGFFALLNDCLERLP